MKTGFVYLWRDLQYVGSETHPWLCIGSHIGSENDRYTTANKRCAAAIRKRPDMFERRILSRIEFDEDEYVDSNTQNHPVRYDEQVFLDIILEHELGSKYYNLKKNAYGWPHKSIHYMKNEDGKSAHAVKAGIVAAIASNAKKDENGKSISGVKGGHAAQAKLTPEQRSELGRMGGLAGGTKGGKASQAKLTPEERIELGRKGGLKGGPIAAIKLNSVSNEVRSERARRGALVCCHIRWHINRGIVNHECRLCSPLVKE